MSELRDPLISDVRVAGAAKIACLGLKEDRLPKFAAYMVALGGTLISAPLNTPENRAAIRQAMTSEVTDRPFNLNF
ncbi:MAG: hypothetical protein R3C68_07155 [Myxococcota bacterium]